MDKNVILLNKVQEEDTEAEDQIDLSLFVATVDPVLFPVVFAKDRDFYGLRGLRSLKLESVRATSHEKYLVENPDFCHLRRGRLHTLVVVHSDPRNRQVFFSNISLTF